MNAQEFQELDSTNFFLITFPIYCYVLFSVSSENCDLEVGMLRPTLERCKMEIQILGRFEEERGLLLYKIPF